jgi:hypothetical protein
MKIKAFLFQYLPVLLASWIVVGTVSLVVLKIDHQKNSLVSDALESQWNETERLSLLWTRALEDLARSLSDLSEAQGKVDLAGEEIRFWNAKETGQAAWKALTPGTAISLKMGRASRFEGRLSSGGIIQARDLGLKSFPSRGEGIYFLHSEAEGHVYAVVPQAEGVVIALLPNQMLIKLFGIEKAAFQKAIFALVATPGSLLSASQFADAPSAQYRLVYTSDPLNISQQAIAQPEWKAYLEGPIRFEMNHREGVFNHTLGGVGTSGVSGSNLRLVKVWKERFLPSEVFFPVAQEIGFLFLVSIATIGFLSLEKMKNKIAAHGLMESVRSILYQREEPHSGLWAQSPDVKEDSRTEVCSIGANFGRKGS